eukprot:jgi/Phyca11/46259/gw1.96.28.1
MQRLLHTFATKITPAQSMKIFTAPKSAKRSWTEHYLYLVAVSEACGGAENLVLDNIVHYAEPGMRVSMLRRSWPTSPSRRRFSSARSTSGHLKAACPSRKRRGNQGQGGDADYVLAVDNNELDKAHWILDTGSSRHLVNDLNLLEDAEDFESQCVAADGGTLKVTKRGSVMLETTAMGKRTKVKLLDVQYAENLERNIISYGLLEKKGFRMEYRGPHRVIAATGRSAGDVLMAALAEAQDGVGPDVQVGTLMQLHRRLGHLNYDTIVKIAKDPASGIALTDQKRN